MNSFDEVLLSYLPLIDPKIDHISVKDEMIVIYSLDVCRASNFWHHYCDNLKHHRVHVKFMCPDPIDIRETYEFADTTFLHRRENS